MVYLRRISGKNYIVLKPTVRIVDPAGGEVPDDVERNLKLAILGWQHNNKFNQAHREIRTNDTLDGFLDILL